MSTVLIEIDVFNDANYIFNTLINDLVVDFTVKWNTEAEQWSCDIDIENGKSANGFALVSGIDLLAQLNFPFQFFVVDEANFYIDPTRESLGVNHKFFFIYEVV